MALTSEQQELVAFFSDRELPAGPQHVNDYSVFINLTDAVQAQLKHLQSDVLISQQSATRLLQEVKNWLDNQPVTIPDTVEVG